MQPPLLSTLAELLGKGLRAKRRLVRAAKDERQWWRDARAARREYETLGCRSNAELDRL